MESECRDDWAQPACTYNYSAFTSIYIYKCMSKFGLTSKQQF